MNNGITLSICIATLNRGKFLAATLNSIISQAREDVEIVIVDGASIDNTGEVVRFYQAKFPRLRYLRLPIKGGVDQDYCRAVELSQGEYCWLFTDDDILRPGAIHAVMDAIQREYDLIIVNAEVKDASLSHVLKNKLLYIRNKTVYRTSDFEQFFIDVAEYLSFIGGVVIKRSLWNEREKEKYLGTAFVHVGVIFQKPFYGNIIVLDVPLISIRYGNALWASESFKISFFKWPDLIWSFAFFSELAKCRVSKREPWRSVKALLIYRGRGTFSLKEYHMLLESRLNSSPQRFFIRAIAQFPSSLLNFGLTAYFFILRTFFKKSSIHAIDLKNSRFYYKNYLKYKNKKRETICV